MVFRPDKYCPGGTLSENTCSSYGAGTLAEMLIADRKTAVAPAAILFQKERMLWQLSHIITVSDMRQACVLRIVRHAGIETIA